MSTETRTPTQEEALLKRDAFEYAKQRDEENRAVAFVQIHQAWKYEYTRLIISVIVIIILIMLIWNVMRNGKISKFLGWKDYKNGEERFAPYPSILAYDTYRSDPAFDYSKPEVRLARDSITW
jgi:hypothetical protein